MTLNEWRLRFVYLLMLLASTGLLIKLGWIQIYDQVFLQKQGDVRTLRTEKIPAPRGMIKDRNGEILAISTPVSSLWINPQEFPDDAASITKIADSLGISPTNLFNRLNLNKDKEFMYLKRQIPPYLANSILNLGISGVYYEKEYKRFYPAGEVAAHIVGFTDINDKGQEGLELAYNKALTSRAGRKNVVKDLKGKTIRYLSTPEYAQAGKDLILSIDLRLQYLAYLELKSAVQKNRATSGSAVILNAKTGEVLAMVNQPSYNPNNRRELNTNALRNRAMLDLLEPGSVVKPLTVMAALKSGKYTPDTLVDTNPGWLKLGKNIVRDVRNYGVLSVKKIITKSSNIGVALITRSLPADIVWNFFSEAGLGHATGTGFPGEGVGHLPKNTPIARQAMSYGYGLSVTPAQMAQTYTIIADGGKLHPISLIKQEKVYSRKLVDSSIANEVLLMMETVTQEGGSGTRARVDGFRVAGKTGTTHKISAKGYSYGEYRAFFAGIAPVSDPRLIVVVVIDDPKGEKYFGGQVAAPVFSKIMANSLRIINASPDALKTNAQKATHIEPDLQNEPESKEIILEIDLE